MLIEDFPPSSSRQALVPADRLSALNPRLVHCSITAYGKHGPLKERAAHRQPGDGADGHSGEPARLSAGTRARGPSPAYRGCGAARHAQGGCALLAREHTGRGRTVETSLMAGALLYHPKFMGEKLAPNTFQTHPAGSAPFYSVYECADGNWVQLGCVHVGFIATAATVMGIKAVLDEPRFGGGRNPQTPEADTELRAIVAQAVRTRPYEEWARIFDDADVPFARVRATEESLDDPQVQVNAMVATLQDPEVGPIIQMGVPIQLSATPGTIKGPRQLPGEQPASIDRGAGCPATSRWPATERRSLRPTARWRAASWRSPTSLPVPLLASYSLPLALTSSRWSPWMGICLALSAGHTSLI